MSNENVKAIEYCEELNRLEEENPTQSGSYMGLDVNFVLKPNNGNLIIYKVEEWEREGSTWEAIEPPYPYVGKKCCICGEVATKKHMSIMGQIPFYLCQTHHKETYPAMGWDHTANMNRMGLMKAGTNEWI
jgi:hypothetical protein